MNTQSLLAMVEELDEAAGERPDYNNIEVFIHEWKKLSAAIRGMVKEREALRSEMEYIAKFCNGSCNEYLMEIERMARKALTASAAKGEGK